MTTITAATGPTTTPILVNGYQARIEFGTIVQRVLGGGIAVGLVDPDPRSGDLELLYANETDADACVQMHRVKTTFTLTDDDLSTIGMVYVVTGLSPALENETRQLWTVRVSYQEIIP